MKKTTLLRETAYLVPPQIADGFVPPAGFDFKISVSLHEVDIKIYGFNGSSWDLLHDTDGLIPSYISDIGHQKYYFESKTGSEQTVRVSFLSSEDEVGLGIRTGSTPQTRKFYDIEEIPVYNGSRDGAMLTIMSDGSLAWLLANEPFIIPSEGGEPSGVVGLEEDSGLTLHGNAQLVDGVLSLDGTAGTYASLPHSSDFDRESGDLTINMWIKANSLPDNWNAGLVSKMGTGWDGYITAISTMQADAGGNMTSGGLQTTSWVGGSNPTANNRAEPSGGISLDVWHHVAYVMPSTGDYKMYFNGQEVHSYAPTARNTSTTGDLRIGGWQNGSYSGFFDGFIDGVSIEKTALSASDISDLHSAGREEQPGPSFTPAGAGTFLEEFTLFGGGTVTDGVLSTSAASPSYYKKLGMVAPSTTATTAVFSMWFNPEQSRMGLYSDQHYPSQVNFGLRMWSTSLLHITTPIGNSSGVTLATPLTLNEWHHALVTVETDIAYTSTSSKSMTVKLFIDGQEVYTKTGNSSTKRIRAYDGMASGTKHYIGAENYNGSVSYKGDGQFDFMEWVDDVTLSDAQILAMYNGGTRGWSVADAVNYQGPAPSDPTGSDTPATSPSVSTGIEALGTNTLSGDAQQTAEGLLITNDGYADTQSNYHNGATEQTISAWFKASELGTVNGNGDLTWRDNGHMIALTRNWAAGGNRANGFVISVASNAVRFGGPHGTNNVVKADYDFSVDTWYKIDLVWTANSMKLYVNGVEVGSTASSGTIAGGSINMRIGRNINQWMSFKGNILGVEVENVAKSSAEILSSYQSEV